MTKVRHPADLPPAYLGKAFEVMTSHYGHPDEVRVEHRPGEGWAVIARWADRDAYLVVGSQEEAEIVATTVKSDFMP